VILERIILAGQELGKAAVVIVTNRIFWTCLGAWLIASVIKMIIYYFQQRRINFRLLINTGHMPSSHSAFVSCLATVIGLEAGWGSPVFMVALGLAVLIMHDAQGVRRAAGHQATILNQIVDDMYEKKPFRPERVKEFLGHTPIQVVAGAFIGVVWGLLFYL
jgi:acid phosphatase family membrane protein YuiD